MRRHSKHRRQVRDSIKKTWWRSVRSWSGKFGHMKMPHRSRVRPATAVQKDGVRIIQLTGRLLGCKWKMEEKKRRIARPKSWISVRQAAMRDTRPVNGSDSNSPWSRVRARTRITPRMNFGEGPRDIRSKRLRCRPPQDQAPSAPPWRRHQHHLRPRHLEGPDPTMSAPQGLSVG